MKADCHMHMVLDGVDWRASIGRGVDDDFIRGVLQTYQSLGYTYLRDGGDRFYVGKRARELSSEYGITYRTPLSPLCKQGHYGSFIGTGWEDLSHYARLVRQLRQDGADFIKIMISGLMDFSRYGVLTEEGLSPAETKELIHIAHEEGMAVMAHCNGAATVVAAAEGCIDSVEHGAYLNEEALDAMTQAKVIWVPTVSTVGNLLGKGRFPDDQVSAILNSLLANIDAYAGIIAPGSDAGAWAVPHGCNTEEGWLQRAGISQSRMDAGAKAVMAKF